MNCSICNDVEANLPYYGATCSKECARTSRLTEQIEWLQQTVRELMLNLGGVR